jgi:hypothetical protein
MAHADRATAERSWFCVESQAVISYENSFTVRGGNRFRQGFVNGAESRFGDDCAPPVDL